MHPPRWPRVGCLQSDGDLAWSVSAVWPRDISGVLATTSWPAAPSRCYALRGATRAASRRSPLHQGAKEMSTRAARRRPNRVFPKTGKGERKWDLLRWVATAAADHGLAPGGGWKAGRGVSATTAFLHPLTAAVAVSRPITRARSGPAKNTNKGTPASRHSKF